MADVAEPLPKFGLLRGVSFHILAVLTTALGWLNCLLALPFSPRRGRLVSRMESLWGRAVVISAGVEITVEGREHLDPTEARVLVANHTSYLDPPLLLGVFPGTLRFVMKEELKKLPFIGWHVRYAGHFLLDRENPREGRRLLQGAVERARRYGISAVVFAEGTRGPGDALQPFKPGAFLLALAGPLPVQPVAILGTHRVLPRGAARPLRHGKVTVRIGPPIPTAHLKGGRGRKELAEQTRQALLDLGVPG